VDAIEVVGVGLRIAEPEIGLIAVGWSRRASR